MDKNDFGKREIRICFLLMLFSLLIFGKAAAIRAAEPGNAPVLVQTPVQYGSVNALPPFQTGSTAEKPAADKPVAEKTAEKSAADPSASQKKDGKPAPDLAAYEARISALEDMVKKKADKPDSKNGFVHKVDGRVYFDSYRLSGDSSSPTPDFRKDLNYAGIKDLRIGVTGAGYEHYSYKADMYYASSTGGVEIRDVWICADDVPLLETVKVGNHRVEEGISTLTPGTQTTFAFYEGTDFLNFYRLGISSRHLWADNHVRLFMGLFEYKPVATTKRNECAENLSWGWIANTRLTYMPYASKDEKGVIDGKSMMLIGGHYGYYNANNSDQTFTERYSELSGFGALQTISLGKVDHYQQAGIELVMQNGPFAFQTEAYSRTYALNKYERDASLFGTYVEGRLFLTGEYRRFNAQQAIWNAVSMNNNLDFKKENGCNFFDHFGAWEVAARWGYTDLARFGKIGLPGINANRVNEFTFGLNWYWTERARMMFDYSHIIPQDNAGGSSDLDVFATALRFYF
ncbi:MAG: porin [Planctomycetia bacterium]|nr:porin [Planctomycetia bacterium]